MPVADSGRHVALDALGAVITHLGLKDRTKTELTGGSPAYARQTITWNAAASGQKTGPNANKTFDVPAAAQVYFASGHTALTAGTEHMYWPLGNQAVQIGTVANAGDVITSYGHGLANGQEVIVYDAFGTIPAGLTDETIYFIVGATTDTFQLSLTSGGAAVTITADGEMTVQRIIPETFGAQGTLTINSGSYTLDGRIV